MRRRIICDRAEPSCGKCIKKGIECSGVNRIRFTEGVARRGKLKDCKIPDISNDGGASLPTRTTFPAIRWPNEKNSQARAERAVKKRRVQRSSAARQDFPDISDKFGELLPTSLAAEDVSSQISATQDVATETGDDVEELVRIEDVILPQPTYSEIQHWIAPLSAEARMLFSYFSEAVAPVMVILDTAMNGYRELVLPMALEDEVLRRAVGVVAAQHLSREKPEMREAAEAGRTAIISRLRKDALSATAEQVFNKFTWATLIVLLVGETVTGSADYSFLVQMLLCLSANSTVDSPKSSLSRFLQTQTNMQASPLRRVAPLTNTKKTGSNCLACLYSASTMESWLYKDRLIGKTGLRVSNSLKAQRISASLTRPDCAMRPRATSTCDALRVAMGDHQCQHLLMEPLSKLLLSTTSSDESLKYSHGHLVRMLWYGHVLSQAQKRLIQVKGLSLSSI
jgi:hypothetical protein